MSTSTDILVELEKRILDRAVFEDASVYQREEMEEDTIEDLMVYLYEDKIEREESDYAMDFRKYRVNVLIKFQLTAVESVLHTEDEKHSARDRKNELVEDIFQVVNLWKIGEQVGDVYNLDVADVDKNFKPENIEDPEDIFRALIVIEFNTAYQRAQ